VAKTIRLDIVTPERLVYSADVNMVIARATDGDLGVLPGHIPLIAGLAVWPLRILTEEGEVQVSVSGGFIEVQPTKITILASSAELPEEIDIDRAMAARERAEKLLAVKEGVDVARAQAALQRALMRLKVVEKDRHND